MISKKSGTAALPQTGIATLPYPDRFFAAALYAGFDSSSKLPAKPSSLEFSEVTALVFYSLYQQATVGPCNIAKPWSWNVVEYAKWTSWNQLGKMPPTEAMRLFVRTLEEEDSDWMRKAQEEKATSGDHDPEWWSKAHDEEITVVSGSVDTAVKATEEAKAKDSAKELVPDIVEKMVEAKPEQVDIPLPSEIVPLSRNGVPEQNGHEKTPDLEADARDHGITKAFNNWFSPSVSGRRPAARYQHAAAIVGNKMFVVGGNHNGRYLSDVQELDLDTFTWSKVEQKGDRSLPAKQATAAFPPCAGHNLIPWEEKLLMVAGHSKEPSDTVTVRAFDVESSFWTVLPCYGQAPVARGGQTVTRMGNTLVLFGGEDSKRRLHNDLHVLDLESMTWDAVETRGAAPSPRADHAATLFEDRYLFFFGGGSHSTCLNDLHVLDFVSMEWSQPVQYGTIPSPRAGHAAVTVGNSWYIMGGGDNKSGISDTLVLNLSTKVWQVIATEQGRTPIASEGLSVVTSFANGVATLISFGGYNGRYSNEVRVLRTGSSEKAKLKVFHSAAAAAAAASAKAAFAVSRPQLGVMVPALNGTNAPEATNKDVPASDVSQLFSADLVEERTEAEQATIPEIVPSTDIVDNTNVSPSVEKSSPSVELQDDLEAAKLETSRIKQELASTIQENSELEKELVAVRGQLAAEQSRCFKLEVDVLELRKKLRTIDTLQKELDDANRQIAAAEEAALSAAQKHNAGVWGWLAGHPTDQKSALT